MPRYEYKYRLPQRRKLKLYWLIPIVLIVGMIVYPFMEAAQLDVKTHDYRVADLPTNLRNLRIAFASDIHQCRWFSQERVNEVINEINMLDADIIVLGGDYAMDSAGAIAFFEKMPQLQARLGVFAVVGNHDRTEPEKNLPLLISQMKAAGVMPLVNEVSRVKVGQTYVYLAGVDDKHNGFPDVPGVAAQVNSGDFVIFAGHTPDLLTDVLKAKSADGKPQWYDLALFGHTHGGQVNLFGYSPFNKLSPEVGARYLTGWLEENRAAVLVSNGVGTSGAPVRLFARPQIHLITLKAR